HDNRPAADNTPAIDLAYPIALDDLEQGRCPESAATPFTDCEVSDYTSGGSGSFYLENLSRYVAGFRLTNLSSGHRIRYGFDTEYKTYNSTRGYSGGFYGTDYGPTADLNGDGVVDGADTDGDGAPDDDPYVHEQDYYARNNPDAPWDPYLYS